MGGSENANNHKFRSHEVLSGYSKQKERLTTRRTKRLAYLIGGRAGKSKQRLDELALCECKICPSCVLEGIPHCF